MAKDFTRDEVLAMLREVAQGDDEWTAQTAAQINAWLTRGDGLAVYVNHDMGHRDQGERQMVSFGSPAAQLEGAEAPERLPDIGGLIGWRYALEGTYRGEAL